MAHKMLVEEVMKHLDPQTTLEPQTIEVVLETLFQMGVLTPSQPIAQQTTTFSDPAWRATFQSYLSLSDRERRGLVLDVQRRNRDWIAQQLDAHRAAWILVCDGKILEFSVNLNDYPSPQHLMKIGQEHDRIPFVFSRPPLFEEIPWSALESNDFYPTLSLNVGAGDWEHSILLTHGKSLTSDFDTGSPYLFFSWEWLLSEQLVVPSPVDFPQTWHHLGRQYVYFTRPLRVGVTDEGGTVHSLLATCYCVENWQNSPLCDINPERMALAGRNLLLRFPFTIELNGSKRITRVIAF